MIKESRSIAFSECGSRTKLHYILKLYRCPSEHSTIKAEYLTLRKERGEDPI